MTTDTALDMAPKQMAPESLQDESPGIDKAGVTGVAGRFNVRQCKSIGRFKADLLNIPNFTPPRFQV